MILDEMRLEDIEQVTKLAEQLGYPNTAKEIERRFRSLQQINSTEDHYALFVARDEKTILGWIQINREAETLLSEPRAEVTALVVHESQRGRKIGHDLLAHAEKWAVQCGLKTVRVRSNVKREDAHRFYLREGYALQKSWHLFEKNL